MQTPTSARQKRPDGEEDGAGLRTPASAHGEHDFGDCGIYDRNDVRDNDHDVSDQDLGEEREDKVRTKLFPEDA